MVNTPKSVDRDATGTPVGNTPKPVERDATGQTVETPTTQDQCIVRNAVGECVPWYEN